LLKAALVDAATRPIATDARFRGVAGVLKTTKPRTASGTLFREPTRE